MKWETYLEYLQVLVRAHPDEINDDDSILVGLIEDTEIFLANLKEEKKRQEGSMQITEDAGMESKAAEMAGPQRTGN